MYETFIVLGTLILTALIIIATIVKYMKITRITYFIVLHGEGKERKGLNTFTRYYWKTKTAETDIKELLSECENIRSNYIGGNDFILSLINENFEIDYKQIYLEYRTDMIKPL